MSLCAYFYKRRKVNIGCTTESQFCLSHLPTDFISDFSLGYFISADFSWINVIICVCALFPVSWFYFLQYV